MVLREEEDGGQLPFVQKTAWQSSKSVI